jgi:DNA-binding transcriptional regulator YdaS (Cro superfamily)
MMNRPFRSVGEMGYAFRDQPFKTLDFSSVSSPDAALLDLFSVNDYSDPSSMRAGVVNLNTRQAPAIAAALTNTISREDTPRMISAGSPSPAPSPLASPVATSIATSLALLTKATPTTNKAGLADLIANQAGLPRATVPKTQLESIARALGEVDQTRTWNLMIDVIAQSGRYPPNATNLQNGFVVEGEQRYWVHVAIDRFTGQVIDKQIEVVNE